MSSRLTRIGLALAVLAAAGCFRAQSGNPTEGDPEKLTGGGGVETTEGNLASLAGSPMGARVSLIPAEFDPLRDTLPDSLTVFANAHGAYQFRGLVPGRYNLEAYLPSAGTRCFRPGVVIARGDRTIGGTDTLTAPGRLRLDWDGSRRGVLTQIGRLFRLDLTGLAADSGSILLDSLPAGLLPPFLFTGVDSASYIWTDSVRVRPGALDSIPILDAWAHSGSLILDTTYLTPDSLEGYPLLVRLASPDFPFGEVSSGGADLRFTTADGSVLPHAVESWDSAAGRAAIWVRLTNPPGGGFGTLRMEWGNPAVASRARSVLGFLPDYTSIWHLDENTSGGPDVLKDAGPFALSASAVGLASESQGVIASAQRFDGTGAHAVAADVELSRTAAGFGVSAWIAPDTSGRPAGAPGEGWTILSNWNEADSTGFIFEYLTNPSSVRLIMGFGGKVSVLDAHFSRDNGVLWHLVGATYDGTEIAVYMDGSKVGKMPAGPENLPLPSREYLIGSRATANLQSPKANFFRGGIDEVRMFHSKPKQSWFSLDFRTQQPGSNQVRFQKLT